MSERFLLFGGTFDPPHRAHVELPALAADVLGCTRTIYIPTSGNPLKADPPTAAHHRLAMLRLALGGRPNTIISLVEIEREGPSYTVETLERLRDEWGPGPELRLLIGADAALQFGRWREPERILELATPAVMLRPPIDRAAFADQLRQTFLPAEVDRWIAWTVELPRFDVDATRLRDRLRSGESTGEDLHPPVLAYIHRNGLYGATPEPGFGADSPF